MNQFLLFASIGYFSRQDGMNSSLVNIGLVNEQLHSSFSVEPEGFLYP
jgi:hypothetical protein